MSHILISDANGQQWGPYAEEEVRQHLAAGSFSPFDWAMRTGDADWSPLQDLLGPAPAPQPVLAPVTTTPHQPQAAITSRNKAAQESGQAGPLWSGKPAANPIEAFLKTILTLGLWLLLKRKTRYEVWPNKIVTTHGRLSKNSQEIRIRDIRGVNVRFSGFAGVFGIGDVGFDTAGGHGEEIVFRGISAAKHVKELVNRLQDELN